MTDEQIKACAALKAALVEWALVIEAEAEISERHRAEAAAQTARRDAAREAVKEARAALDEALKSPAP